MTDDLITLLLTAAYAQLANGDRAGCYANLTVAASLCKVTGRGAMWAHIMRALRYIRQIEVQS